MSHNPHNNYPNGNKFRHERHQPALAEASVKVEETSETCEDCKVEETPVISEIEICEEAKIEEDVAQDAAAVTEEPDVAQEDFIEEDTEELAVVANCRKLNIREAPNMDADIVTVLPAGSEVMVDITNSTDDFYKVCNAVGIEGYCMKQYIELRG